MAIRRKHVPRTPEYFWWSCKAVNECLGSANRLLAASPRPRSPKVFGGFCFVRPSDSRYVTEPEWAGKSEYTAPITPVGKRRTALIERLLKHLVHRWKQGQLYKRINPSWALGGFCVSKTLERAGIPSYSTLGEL